MTPPPVRETLALVADVLDLEPHIRLGQLLAWIGELGDDEFQRGLWDLENEELHALLKTHFANLQQRIAEPISSKLLKTA